MDKQQFSNPVKVHLNKSFTSGGRVESTELKLLTFNLQNCYTQLVASSSFLQSPQYYCVCVLCTVYCVLCIMTKVIKQRSVIMTQYTVQ